MFSAGDEVQGLFRDPVSANLYYPAMLYLAARFRLGQFDAIAFVIAAKNIARFERLNDRDFAEIYLVGTLASVTWAMSSALLISYLLS